MKYDLHLHSCLSPCADNDMTPATIAGISKLNGAEIIAITDHNSALNLPAAKKACDEYGLKLLAGIEVTCEEEFHILCYFPSVENALKMGEIIYESLPQIICDEYVYGVQLVADENDIIIKKVDKLLTNACGLNMYRVDEQVKKLGGICVPAHIDKDSYSILASLGFMPQDISFPLVEIKRMENAQRLKMLGQIDEEVQIISSSDAHFIDGIREQLPDLPQPCLLDSLISLC